MYVLPEGSASCDCFLPNSQLMGRLWNTGPETTEVWLDLHRPIACMVQKAIYAIDVHQAIAALPLSARHT
jgi:hypothetical protein